MLRATALYNNISETPEELTFDAGDQLIVLEQDVGGAVGWWLCSLRGRTGIVPGNRLRINGNATPTGNRFKSGGDSSPVSAGSRFVGGGGRQYFPPDQVVVPHKSGNIYVYDSPRHTNMDYDVPPSRYKAVSNGRVARSSPSPCMVDRSEQDYDVPPSLNQSSEIYDSPSVTSSVDCNSPCRAGDSFYDVPPSMSGFESDKISLSNRSSVLSMLSTGSRSSLASARSWGSPSTSARSSIDVASSHEIYDIPRPSADRSVAPPSRMPLCSKYSYDHRDSVLEDYAVPRETTVDQLSSGSRLSTPKDDDNEIYDTPKRSARTEYDNPVYDIPPVSLNTTGTSSTDSTSVSPSVHSHTSDPGAYDELRSGTDRQLTALRDSVLLGVEKLLRLVSDRQQHGKEYAGQLTRQVASCGVTVQSGLRELIQHGNERINHETDAQKNEEVRRRCEVLSSLLARATAQLDQVSMPSQDASSQSIVSFVDLVESVTSIPSAVSDFYSLLLTHTVPNSSANCIRADKANSSSILGGNNFISSHIGRSLPPPPVMPKPAKSSLPTKFDITERPLPAPPSTSDLIQVSASKKLNMSIFEKATDYDYVLIAEESDRDKIPGETPPMTRVPSADMNSCTANGCRSAGLTLSDPDRELLVFYEAQVRAHTAVVDTAVCDFCRYASSCGGAELSADVFVQRGKLVVLAAHKLVYVGDSVARHVSNTAVCNQVATAANNLCDRLKIVVTATKEAAILSPHNAILRLRAVESVKAAAAACTVLGEVMASFVA